MDQQPNTYSARDLRAAYDARYEFIGAACEPCIPAPTPSISQGREPAMPDNDRPALVGDDHDADELAAIIAAALADAAARTTAAGVGGGGRYARIEVRLLNGQAFAVQVEELL